MNIQLKKLTLTNFKGIRSRVIDFSNETTISGKNGSGKTTIFDSFSFLLFGKNSQGLKDFEIKTLDENNNPIHKLDHEVEAVIDVDGTETAIKRSFREKWEKPKGQVEEVFNGHETTRFWNDVPVSQSEFKAKIDSLCPEDVFKMITNPYGFTSLHWKEQREVLFKIAGETTDEEIAKGNKDFEDLLAKLTGKNFDEFKKEIASKKKKVNDELKLIPSRIEEVNRLTPETIDTESIDEEIKALEEEIKTIDDKIADRSKANESVLKAREDKQKQIYGLRAEIVKLEDIDSQNARKANKEAENKRDEVKSKKESLEKEQKTLSDAISNNNQKIVILEAETSSLRAEWNTFNEEEVEFDDELATCPTCQRDFPSDDVEAKKEELKANFNTDKQKRLADIRTKGQAKKAELEQLKAESETSRELLKGIDSQLDDIRINHGNLYQPIEGKTETKVNPEIGTLKGQIKVLQDLLDAPQEKIGEDFSEKRTSLRTQIDGLKKELSVIDQINRAKVRIEELEGQAKAMGQEVADLERLEFTMTEFTKSKIESIEDKINSKFSSITWKMYRKLINSGEDECCECLINGVPYSDANTGSKMRAGLEIVNALCEYYDTYAPVFLDNRESVQTIPDMKSQIINLVVTTEDKLTVK